MPEEDQGAEQGGTGNRLPAVPDDIPADQVPLWHLLLRVLGRTPAPRDMEIWNGVLDGSRDGRDFLRKLVGSARFRNAGGVRVKYPAGHFFSPVVNPDEVGDYVRMSRRAGLAGLPGIPLDLEAMSAFWQGNAAFIASTPFTDEPVPENRYSYRGGPYSYGDGITARAMINHLRPRRVVEIGSGYSSACMLDAAEHAGLEAFHLTCIEPYPARLRGLLRPGDDRKVTIHERGVQGMPLDIFSSLAPNDVLFIDSTHVLKTGSDVHYELFHILPALKPGVVVHFHDCRYPFEYSDKQIFSKNYSWNEVYGVRALLMDSTRYKVLFWGSFFADRRAEEVRAVSPVYLRNPGSALWLKVV
ncbi:class I SAM-dependent methyltransferase [Pararoseomonas sp. SCSIO 73927]|uniref:class I SAM-dependent methyltransferase n=1 Tax=Pararoseomonas sp. SCSIO 73927 TaxID=3114537 RepID=UPI0030D517EF